MRDRFTGIRLIVRAFFSKQPSEQLDYLTDESGDEPPIVGDLLWQDSRGGPLLVMARDVKIGPTPDDVAYCEPWAREVKAVEVPPEHREAVKQLLERETRTIQVLRAPIEVTPLPDQVEWHEKAMTVIKAVAEWNGHARSGPNDDDHCVFCHAWLDYEPHEPECVALIAQSLAGADGPVSASETPNWRKDEEGDLC